MLPPRNSHMSASGTSAGSKLWGGMLTSLVSRVGVMVICRRHVEVSPHVLSSASPSSDGPPPPVQALHASARCFRRRLSGTHPHQQLCLQEANLLQALLRRTELL